MKITAICLNYPPNRFIGAELALHRVLKYLQATGHDVTVVATEARRAHTYDGISVLPAQKRPQADRVIVNAGLAYRANQWYPKRPIFVWAHNIQVPTLLDLRAAVKHGNRIIANTHHMAQALTSVFGLINPLVLHPPLGDITPYPLGNKVTLINANAAKGGKLFQDLAALNPDVEFQAVAGGYGNQVVKPTDNLTVIPHSPDISQVWANTRILLVPSEYESYSMTAAEAHVRNIPVIATHLPGIIEAAPWERVLDTLNIHWWQETLIRVLEVTADRVGEDNPLRLDYPDTQMVDIDNLCTEITGEEHNGLEDFLTGLTK